jgi:hypothetical protein
MAALRKNKRDDELVKALACGATVESAARKLGLSERTVYRRLADPQFKRRIKQEGAEILQRCNGMLVAGTPGAIKTLVILQGDTFPPAVRHAAAKALLSSSLKFRETIDIEERVAVLEERLSGESTAKREACI